MLPHVTVVVCTRDRPSELRSCLTSLARQSYPRFDILVIDNGVLHAVDDVCRSLGVACIREPLPGLTRARNLGARAARGDIVAYIDDDATAEDGWVAALAHPFAQRDVAAVAGRTRYMLARGESLAMSDQESPEQVIRPAIAVDRSMPDWFALACFGGIGDGNTMAFRRSVLLEAARFDERIGRGRPVDSGDEHVAFMSLIADGYRVVHEPTAVVRHPMPADPAGLVTKRRRDVQSSISYLLFLFAQLPAHRWRIARFVTRAVVRRLRHPLRSVAAAQLRPAQWAGAVVDGCRLYTRARRQWALEPKLDPRAARAETLT